MRNEQLFVNFNDGIMLQNTVDDVAVAHIARMQTGVLQLFKGKLYFVERSTCADEQRKNHVALGNLRVFTAGQLVDVAGADAGINGDVRAGHVMVSFQLQQNGAQVGGPESIFVLLTILFDIGALAELREQIISRWAHIRHDLRFHILH